LRHLQRFEPRDYTDLLALGIDDSKLRSRDLFVAPDALSNGSSDASYLQIGPAAARYLGGKLPGDVFNRHRSKVFTTAGAHGQRIRSCLAIACYQ